MKRWPGANPPEAPALPRCKETRAGVAPSCGLDATGLVELSTLGLGPQPQPQGEDAGVERRLSMAPKFPSSPVWVSYSEKSSEDAF